MSFAIMTLTMLLFWALLALVVSDRPSRILKGKATKKLDPVDYQWGRGKDLSSLLNTADPEIPMLLVDTTWTTLEKEWEKAHPTEEQKLKAELEEKNELISGKSALIASLRKELEEYKRRLRARVREYESPIQMQSLNYDGSSTMEIRLSENATKEDIIDHVQNMAVEMAKVADIPGGMFQFPAFTVSVPRALKTYSSHEELVAEFEKRYKNGAFPTMLNIENEVRFNSGDNAHIHQATNFPTEII